MLLIFFGLNYARWHSHAHLRRRGCHHGHCRAVFDESHDLSNFEIDALDREIELQELKNKGMLPLKIEEPPNTYNHDIELKFTNLSEETAIPDYKRNLLKSKVFRFKPTDNNIVNISILSTTTNYHPQIVFSEEKDGKFKQLNTETTSTKFICSKENSYIIEVGHNDNLKTEPFPDIREGSFIVIISSKLRSLRDILVQDSTTVSLHGYEGVVPFDQSQSLKMHHLTKKALNMGFLNYLITPMYNNSKKSVTLYYHQGSDILSGKQMRATEVEVKCNQMARSTQTYYGKQKGDRRYKFTVNSKRICDLIDLIKN